MPMLSHLHDLFSAEQCQASIRTLRWKDRPLQCPRCQSHHIGQWGTYQYRPGCKRYWCHSCKRTFNDYVFHAKPATDSRPKLPPIPGQSCR
jgi:transposase-like protein